MRARIYTCTHIGWLRRCIAVDLCEPHTHARAHTLTHTHTHTHTHAHTHMHTHMRAQVGYGDLSPKTVAGRNVGIFIILCGAETQTLYFIIVFYFHSRRLSYRSHLESCFVFWWCILVVVWVDEHDEQMIKFFRISTSFRE